MALKLRCPGCAATFRLAESLRGKFQHQMFCPKCGESILITGAGAANTITITSAGGPRRAEERPAMAPLPQPRRSWKLVLLLLLVAVAFLGGGGALAVYLSRGQPNNAPQVGGHDRNDPANEPDEPQTGGVIVGGHLSPRDQKRNKKDLAKDSSPVPPTAPENRQGAHEGKDKKGR
jgi:hypothetical protein